MRCVDGLFADASLTQTNAYDLWAEQVNAAGGLNIAGVKRRVQLVSYDDQSNPGKAATTYEKLITSDAASAPFKPKGAWVD
jgi:branched-chain amino acid transport system substrate-binding protein